VCVAPSTPYSGRERVGFTAGFSIAGRRSSKISDRRRGGSFCGTCSFCSSVASDGSSSPPLMKSNEEGPASASWLFASDSVSTSEPYWYCMKSKALAWLSLPPVSDPTSERELPSPEAALSCIPENKSIPAPSLTGSGDDTGTGAGEAATASKSRRSRGACGCCCCTC